MFDFCIYPELILIAKIIRGLLKDIVELGETPDRIFSLECWCGAVGIEMTPDEMIRLWGLTKGG